MRLLAILAALPLMACSYNSDDGPGIAGAGSGTTRTYAATGFTTIELRGSDDVDVRVGSAFSVRAEGPEDELARLRIETHGDALRIGRANGMSWGSHDKVKVYVTMPRIVAAELAGSGDLTIDRAEGAAFSADAAGSGDIAIATLAVDKAVFDIAGSGGISARGIAKRAEVNIAGSGDVAARGLKAGGAKVAVAGSGSVALDVAGDATVSIMGSGDVDLGAGARCRTSQMGSGSVRCGG